MRVLIVPEDPTLDQHVLKPVVERLFRDLGVRCRVDVLRDPHISGISQALDPGVIAGVILDNPMIDLFLLAVDRDCDRFGNTAKARDRCREHAGRLIAVVAREELEVWALALHRRDLGVRWQDVRAACDPKEDYWDPFIAGKRWLGTVGKGRKRAMRDLGAGWAGLLQVCDELGELRETIRGWLDARGAEA